jgi:hypothetical protein
LAREGTRWMTHRLRYLTTIVIALAVVATAAAPGPPDEVPDRYLLLQAMPRERRVTLAENLERFDKLGPAEQAAIRKLDAQIARKNPVEQARYRTLLRRYHLWVKSLTDEQQKELRDAPSVDERLALAIKLRKKEKEAGGSVTRFFNIRTGDYGLVGPYETAHLLKIWNKLPAQKKTEIQRHQDRGPMFKEIRDQNRFYGVQFVPFPAAEEKHYDALLDADRNFKEQLGSHSKRVDMTPKKAEAAHAKGEVVAKRFELRFTEFLYFEEHKPKAVSQENLERFSTSCPAWLHSMLDSLSAEDARNYLTILYRLLYPEPGEMPVEPKPAAGSAAPTPSPAKTPSKKSRAAGPF